MDQKADMARPAWIEIDLSALRWKAGSAAPQAWAAVLPGKPSWRFESLYAKGKRQWRARWPNGNPETYCARDLHGGKCEGYAQVGMSTVSVSACGQSCCEFLK